MKLLPLLAMAFMLSAPAHAQTVSPAGNPLGHFEWAKGVDDTDHWLYRDTKIIGRWHHPDQTYQMWDGRKFGMTCKPPIDPPTRGAEAMRPLQAWQLSGVSHDKIDGHEQLSYGGKIIPPGQLTEAFEGKLTDDSAKGHVILWAKDVAEREAVLADWSKLPQDFRDRFTVCAVPPDHFWMQDRFAGKPRFFTEGDPSVILMTAKGQVLFRRPQAEQAYKPADMQDLLKSDPDYKPALDPGGPAPAPTTSSIPPAVWIVAGLGALHPLLPEENPVTEFLAFLQTPLGIGLMALIAHALPYMGVKLPILHQLLVFAFGALQNLSKTPPTPAPGGSSPPAGPAPAPALSQLQGMLDQVQNFFAHPVAKSLVNGAKVAIESTPAPMDKPVDHP